MKVFSFLIKHIMSLSLHVMGELSLLRKRHLKMQKRNFKNLSKRKIWASYSRTSKWTLILNSKVWRYKLIESLRESIPLLHKQISTHNKKSLKKIVPRKKCLLNFKLNKKYTNCSMKNVMTIKKQYFKIYQRMKHEETWLRKWKNKFNLRLSWWVNCAKNCSKLQMEFFKTWRRLRHLLKNVWSYFFRIPIVSLGWKGRSITTDWWLRKLTKIGKSIWFV